MKPKYHRRCPELLCGIIFFWQNVIGWVSSHELFCTKVYLGVKVFEEENKISISTF